MRPLVGRLIAVALSVGLLAAAAAPPPEPPGYWTGVLHGATPAGLTGATVLDAAALAQLIATENPVVLDVAAAEAKPADFPADRLWRPIHRSIPGSVWMPGAGEGQLSSEAEARLAALASTLTGGRRDRPIVTFCHQDCWASWNAAKRLLGLGYTRVYWLRDGIEGWQAAHAVAVVTAAPGWTTP